jgi:D-alanyl-D-alanine carboxypeptidase (penicillin-binding protein 5/6)
VYDAGTHEPIAGLDPSTPRPIASLAKLMTALVVFDEIQLDELVTVPKDVEDLPPDAAKMDLRPGERWPAGELLRGMLANSANDAALALALHVTDGDKQAFVDLMNQHADELGMDDSQFASPTGLDTAGHASTSTPMDLVTLAEAVLAHKEARAAVAERVVKLRRPGSHEPLAPLPNRNPLLGSYPGVDGVKTGFTDAAGYMLIVHHVDPKTGGRLFVVTFASTSEATRASDARALLDWARPLYSQVRVLEGGMPLGTVPVQGSDEQLQVFACEDLVATARVGQRLTPEIIVPRSVAPPIKEAQEVGTVRVRLGAADDPDAPAPATTPLCAARAIAERSVFERAADHAREYRRAWKAGIEGVTDAWSTVLERAA